MPFSVAPNQTIPPEVLGKLISVSYTFQRLCLGPAMAQQYHHFCIIWCKVLTPYVQWTTITQRLRRNQTQVVLQKIKQCSDLRNFGYVSFTIMAQRLTLLYLQPTNHSGLYHLNPGPSKPVQPNSFPHQACTYLHWQNYELPEQQSKQQQPKQTMR